MKKELIICITIVSIILIGNYVTENYEEESINKITNNLEEIKTELKKQEINEKLTEEKLENLDKQWNEVKDKMAYFIEHNELEKVETSIVELKSFYESEEYAEVICEIDKNMFVLKHIKEKNNLGLENIF